MAGLKWYFYLFLVLIFIIPSVSGTIAVRNMVITPSGNLVSGEEPPQEVRVSFGVDFIPEGGMTFSSSNSLDMFTDLDNAQWSYSMEIDGNANPPQIHEGEHLSVNGWVLSYPSRRDLTLRVNLTGDVPDVQATGKKTIVKVGVYNGVNEVYPGSTVTREANVILPGSTAVLTTTPSAQLSPVQTVISSLATTVPVQTGSATPAIPSSSITIPVWVVTIILLLISFIPLGLLVFHDYFSPGPPPLRRSYRELAGIGIVHALCGIGLLFVLIAIQAMYVQLISSGQSLAPVFVLLVLMLVSYVTLSSFALAAGSVLQKALRLTINVHVAAGIAVIILVPLTILILGQLMDPVQLLPLIIGTAVIAALGTIILALWQDHTTRVDPGGGWLSSLFGFSKHVKGLIRPGKVATRETSDAIAILNTRLARGEISLEEYNRLKEAIRK